MSSIHRDTYSNSETKGPRGDDHHPLQQQQQQQQHSSSSSSPSVSPPFPSLAASSSSSHHRNHPHSRPDSSPSFVYPTPSTPSRPSPPQSYAHQQHHHPYNPAAHPSHYSQQHQYQHQFYNAQKGHHSRREPDRHHCDPHSSGHHRTLARPYQDTRSSYSAGPGHHHHHYTEDPSSQARLHPLSQSSSTPSRPSSTSHSYNHNKHRINDNEHRRPSHSQQSPPHHHSTGSSAAASASNYASSHPPHFQPQTQPSIPQSCSQVYPSVKADPEQRGNSMTHGYIHRNKDDDDETEEKHPKASIDSTTPSNSTPMPHQDCSSSTAPASIKRTSPTPPFSTLIASAGGGPTHKATIKIVQQPLHARMCGFGEKDRRPIDPPPIVQLILDEPGYNELKAPPKPIAPVKPRKSKRKGAKRGRKPGKKTLERLAAAAAAAEAAAAQAATEAAASKSQEEVDDENDEDGADDGLDGDLRGGQTIGGERDLKDKQPSCSSIPSLPQPRRRGRPSHASLTEMQLPGRKHGRDSLDNKDQSEEVIEDETDDSDQEWPRYEGGAGALREDPLYVLQVSLWSEDGSEVRNMIATPGQSDPPRLTRILMGAVVVSPTLLLNEDNQTGWYFSFPDLSVRTEGVYTLKFSLMQFANFDFDERGGSQASTLIGEETSVPFTVYSAKKFPGMTESTELSKAFARQGLKIPIRNDLRVRKANEGTPPLFSSTAQV